MNALAHWIHAPWMQALGMALLHFVWEGGAVAALLAAALCLRLPARVRYALACLALFAMPLVFGLTLWQMLPAAARVVRVAPAFYGPAPWPGSPAAPAAGWSVRDALAWTVPFWMGGVLFLHGRSLGGWFAVERLRRTGACAAPQDWQDRLVRLRGRLRVSRPVLLLESCLTDVPAVIGWLRPVILVPAGLLTGLPADQVEALLLHELAHISRLDYPVNLLQMLVENLLFYHPAVWWVSGLIRSERECCCDDAVVALSGDRRGYAAALAALEQSRWEAGFALPATGGGLVNRIRRLLRQPELPQISAPPILSAGLLLVSVAVTLFAWQPQNPQPSGRVAGPYQKWLNEDAAYIITKEESAAFENLATDAEREHFIEQFWERRDPTPGTVENEFKEEHYRRIAYANQHYAAQVPGWRTDRGRNYIRYGPPDEKESHPAGVPAPYEEWLYQYIEGIGGRVILRFEDPQHDGTYSQTSDPAVAPRK